MKIQSNSLPSGKITVEGFGMIRAGVPEEVPENIAKSLLKKERLGFFEVTETQTVKRSRQSEKEG